MKRKTIKNVRDSVNLKIEPVQKALTDRGPTDGAHPETRHGSGDAAVVARVPDGGGQRPADAAAAGRAAGGTRAPRRGGGGASCRGEGGTKTVVLL